MSRLRGIDAEYVSFRTVNGRKVLQIVCEVDITRTAEVLEALGHPNTGESLYVAIARLDLKAAQASEVSGSSDKPHKKWNDLSLREQAVLRCKERAFQEYMRQDNESGAAEEVNRYCQVDSRTRLDMEPAAGERWKVLELGYQRVLTTQKYGAARR